MDSHEHASTTGTVKHHSVTKKILQQEQQQQQQQQQTNRMTNDHPPIMNIDKKLPNQFQHQIYPRPATPQWYVGGALGSACTVGSGIRMHCAAEELWYGGCLLYGGFSRHLVIDSTEINATRARAMRLRSSTPAVARATRLGSCLNTQEVGSGAESTTHVGGIWVRWSSRMSGLS